ncbi:Fic family protein [Olsenella umbonata]|uniref:Fic family protein n=1 Tax=Parafannyhessea umbonata TaxID=604330 RepID=A0A7X9XZH9_9ACTN|nr:Fic family protein [Parafannyhessea umbonata]NMF24942.1 Fic family protein [Parafannyhessea umbonata]
MDEKSTWPFVGYEELGWHVDDDDRALMSKSARRKIGETYCAAVPPMIAQLTPEAPADLLRHAMEVESELIRFDALLSVRGYDLPALLLRSESSASSRIENLTASVRNVALAELDATTPRNSREIAGNVRAMREAIELKGEPSVEDVLRVHASLMSVTGESFGGELRDEQVWIGGSAFGPQGAAFVPPSQERVPALLDDLMAFVRRDDLDPVVQTAVAHAQFETIHPFVDGNGRTGRALLHRWLCYHDVLRHATLPISSGLLHDVDSYMGALQSYHDGDVRPIVGELVDALEVALALAQSATRQIDDIIERWQEQMGERRGSAIRRLPAVLVAQPVVSVAHVADHLQITPRAARDVIARACEYGMLTPMGNRRRGVFYQADELLDVLEQMTSRPAMRRMLAR